MFSEGGIILSPAAKDYSNAKIFNWDFKCGVNFQTGRLLLFAGYGFTNFDLHSGTPKGFENVDVNNRHYTHSGFIGTAYKL